MERASLPLRRYSPSWRKCRVRRPVTPKLLGLMGVTTTAQQTTCARFKLFGVLQQHPVGARRRKPSIVDLRSLPRSLHRKSGFFPVRQSVLVDELDLVVILAEPFHQVAS